MSEKSIILRSWSVKHPVHGEVMVAAPDEKLQAIVAASHVWGVPWSKIARDCDCERGRRLKK